MMRPVTKISAVAPLLLSIIVLALGRTGYAAPTSEAADNLAIRDPGPDPIVPRAATPIPNRYIVTFRTGSGLGVVSLLTTVISTLTTASGLGGIMLLLDMSSTVASLLANVVPGVLSVEPDSFVNNNAYVTQYGATWGISRISSKVKGSTKYVYDSSAGTGTCSYVIDTGVQINHMDFGGRAYWLANYAGDGKDTDLNGHGTHVAGTIGSKTWGVAKNTSIYAVKVLDANGGGTVSGVIQGLNAAVSDCKTRTKIPNGSCRNGCAANLSLGAGQSPSLNAAAAAAVSAGVFVAVAAGNSGADAGGYSPASEPSVCTVGATDINNAWASYSNYGPYVDIAAPGSAITSTWISNTNLNATNTLYGTSMASPHVTGLGMYLNTTSGGMSPAALCERIQQLANKHILSSVPQNTLNYLAFNGAPS